MTLEDGTVSATSTDGMATAMVASPPMHAMGLPAMHDLSAWLTANPGGTVSVPAGSHRDVGGVRFTCPEGGADCAVMVTLEDGTVTATSTDGMAMASLAPPSPQPPQQPSTGGGGGGGGQPPAQPPAPPPAAPRGGGRFDLSGWLHGLNGLGIKNTEGVSFGIEDRESVTKGRTRFSCRGPGCRVQILRIGYSYDVTYDGDVTASFHEEPGKMWAGIGRGWNYTGTGAHNAICDLREGETCHPPGYLPGSVKDGDLLFSRGGGIGSQNYIMAEDGNASIPASHGFTGRRYAWSPESHGTVPGTHLLILKDSDGGNGRLEAVLYTNADPATDTGYLSYGRWLYIDADSNWTVDAVAPMPLHHSLGGPRKSLGTAPGTATYSGGATGFYAVDGGADAGHFTARATLNANLDSLGISGVIDRFVDENGRSRNWRVDLQPGSFLNRTTPEIRASQQTVWTIDGTAAAAGGEWRGQAWQNGRWIQGVFDAAHGTDGHMVGSYLTEKQ